MATSYFKSVSYSTSEVLYFIWLKKTVLLKSGSLVVKEIGRSKTVDLEIGGQEGA